MSLLDLFRRLVGLPTSASNVSDQVDGLDFALSLATAAVGLALIVYTIVLVRCGIRSSGPPPRLEGSRRSELGLAGAVTLIFVLFWVVGFSQYSEMTSPPADAETVYVEAKQWMWKFAYADGRAANDVLTVPAGRPVKLVMSSRDVIHSFFVPAFRLKQDVVPGRTTTLWFNATKPGRYPIWCAEYCGVSHSAMLGTVEVLSPADYEVWKTQDHGDGALRGQEIAHRRGCVACHSVDGRPSVGPTFRHLYGAERTLVDGRRVIADEAYLVRAMVEPNAEVVAGYPAGMPTYQGLLDPAETGALLEFLRGLR